MAAVSRCEITITNVNDGKPSYTHPAYSWSADGTDRFTKTYPHENLLKGSKDFSGVWRNATSWTVMEETYKDLSVVGKKTAWTGIGKNIEGSKGDKFVYSVYLRYSGENNADRVARFYTSGNSVVSDNNNVVVNGITNEWKRFTFTFTLTTNVTLGDSDPYVLFPRVELARGVNDEYLLQCGLKVAKITASENIIDEIYTPHSSENYADAYPTFAGTYVDDEQTASNDPADYTWQRILGPGGKDGESAPLVSLSGATQAITVSKTGTVTPSSSFQVTGTAVNTTISTWTYSLNGGNFGSALPTGVTRSGNTVTINPVTATFDTFTIKAADATVSDVFTISRIKDGGEGPSGADAYTVFLTNESYTFAGSTTAALAGSTTTEVIVYKGINKITPTSITVGTKPTGLSSSVSGSIITLSATTALVSKSGTVPITITADGKTFTKQFAYALSLQGGKGDPGNPGKGVSAEEISYAISQDGTTPPTSGWSGTRPTPKAGWYMWTRTRFKYTDNTYSAYFYLVAQQGKDAIVISDTAPANPTKGTLWQDSSVVPQIIKVFDGTAWSMWGMPIDNLLATNILSENGVFKRLEGAEIVGSEFINPYTRSYNDGTFAQGTQRIGSAELYNSGVIKNSQGAITQSYETIFSHQFVSMARYSGSAAGDQNELIASASLSFDTLTLNDRENGFSGMIHARQLTDTPWINLSYAAGFRTSENNPCQYQISYNMKGKRTITFRGQVERTSGAMTGTTYPFGIGTVPASIRPTGNTFKLAAGDATELQTVRVAMLGTAQPGVGNSIQIKVVGNSQYVDISALTYDIP